VRIALADLLVRARAVGGAVPGCNVYTIDQASGIVDAAVAARCPLILQVLPAGANEDLWALVAGLRVLADAAGIPIALQLDHCADPGTIHRAIAAGVDGVMADGSGLPLADNAAMVAGISRVAHQQGVAVEAEMGRLSGNEDGWTIQAREARLTDPGAVASFLTDTGADLLAVSIGNVHGSTRVPPTLDLDRLEAIARATAVPLVLHGGSGLDDGQLAATIALGVSKVNVNTELRTAYRDALTTAPRARELAEMLGDAHRAVGIALRQVLERLGSVGLLDRHGWGGTGSDGT
jgi:tagatose 1,6-diphosphate aldolase GatY/KbaY